MLRISFAQVSQHLISFSDIKSGLIDCIKYENSFILFLIELQFQWITFMLPSVFIEWVFDRIIDLSFAVSIECHVFVVLRIEVFDLIFSTAHFGDC